MQMHIYQQFS